MMPFKFALDGCLAQGQIVARRGNAVLIEGTGLDSGEFFTRSGDTVRRFSSRKDAMDALDGGPGSGPQEGGGKGRAAAAHQKLSKAKEQLAGIQSGSVTTMKGPLGTYKISDKKAPYHVTKEQAISALKQEISDANKEVKMESSLAKHGSARI